MADQPQQVAADAGAGALGRSRGYLEATGAEMRKVTWPTREELVRAKKMIILLRVALGLTIGFIDFILQKILVDGVAAVAR